MISDGTCSAVGPKQVHDLGDLEQAAAALKTPLLSLHWHTTSICSPTCSTDQSNDLTQIPLHGCPRCYICYRDSTSMCLLFLSNGDACCRYGMWLSANVYARSGAISSLCSVSPYAAAGCTALLAAISAYGIWLLWSCCTSFRPSRSVSACWLWLLHQMAPSTLLARSAPLPQLSNSTLTTSRPQHDRKSVFHQHTIGWCCFIL